MFYGFQSIISHTQGNLLGNGLDCTKYNMCVPNNIVLLVTIEEFETNLVLVNVNKLKPYKYMDLKVKKKNNKCQYWEQNASGVQEANFDIKVEIEGC